MPIRHAGYALNMRSRLHHAIRPRGEVRRNKMKTGLCNYKLQTYYKHCNRRIKLYRVVNVISLRAWFRHPLF